MVVEAIEYSRFGNEEVLDLLKIDSTALDVNQVRVEVHAVGLNPKAPKPAAMAPDDTKINS